MFWDISYSNNANIDALLNKEDCTLKELLDEEDILQECKTQNQKLVKFLSRPEVVDEMIVLISTEPPSDLDERQRFLHPNVACEILTSDLPAVQQRIVEDQNLLNKLFAFFEQRTQLNPLLASFICKTFGNLIMKKMEQDWFLYQTICLHVLEFIKSKDNFLDVMLHHFSTPVVMDLLLTMLNEMEDAKMKSGFLEWVNEKGLVEKLIDVLFVVDESEKHAIVAQFLMELIKTGRCNRQNETEDRKSLPNPLLQRMEESQTTTRLIDAILCDSRSESGILAGLQVLLCLLENSIIQEPVSQSALQQIIDAEKEHHDEIVASLMSIIQPRVHQLFELLLNPPMKSSESGVNGQTAPPKLGNVRLQLCNLFTVLLETENSSIIEEICKTNFFAELLNLFKQYCWNNFLHNYVKKCFVYGVQAFDTIPNNTQLVISALQKHIIVDCKLADKLIDCWNENAKSQESGGRRLGYMGHLVDILGAIHSTVSASEDFRALIESSLTGATATEGSGEPSATALDIWSKIMQSNEDELIVQKRFLADCDPSDRQDYTRDGLISGFPSNTDESENDTEDFAYSFNTPMHNTVNGMSNKYYNEDFTNDDEMESRSNMFEEACSNNISTISFDADFDNWDQQQQYQFNNALNLKSTHRFDRDSDEEEEENEEDQSDPFTTDPFADSANNSAATSGFDAIIDNFADFDSHFASMTPVDVDASTIPNDNVVDTPTPANPPFSSDDTTTDTSTATTFNPFALNGEQQKATTTPTCFVATTQVIEISSAPPPPSSPPPAIEEKQEKKEEKEKEEEEGEVKEKELVDGEKNETVDEESVQDATAATATTTKREFQLGPNINANITSIMQKTILALDELEDEEFFSLRDDSNEMSSLTDDTDRKLVNNNENTEIPDDDDDDFASADESSSKGNSEDDSNSNGGDQFSDCHLPSESNRNDIDEHSKVNGVGKDEESDDDKTITADEIQSEPSDEPMILIESKIAQESSDEKAVAASPIVPLENGSV